MATTKKNDGFKLLAVLRSNFDSNKGRMAQVELHSYKGRKFKFVYENSNGTPCGFDHKHCILFFDEEGGTWNYIADKSEILTFANGECDCVNYFGREMAYKRYAAVFMDACKELVKVLYS